MKQIKEDVKEKLSEKYNKLNQTNQGADNPSYNNLLTRKRLMWLQQLISKKKYFLMTSIGAYFICSLIIFIVVSYFENLKLFTSEGLAPYSHISIDTLTNHKVFFFIVLPILIGFLCLFIFYKIQISFGNLNVGQKGTARWTTRQEIEEQYKCIPLKEEPFEGMGGIPVAKGDDCLYIDDSNTNNLIIGTTRSGKDETIINPMSENLSRAEEQCSMIFTDPKIELAFMQIPELTKRGYECHILNLIDLEYSSCYNPLKVIVEEYEFEVEHKNNDTSNTQQMCEVVGVSLFPDIPNDPQPFFNIGSRDLFIAGVYACIEDAYKNDMLENELAKILHEKKEEENEVKWAKTTFSDYYLRYFLCKEIDEIYRNDPKNVIDCDTFLYSIQFRKASNLLTNDVEMPSKDTYLDIMKFYNEIYNKKENGIFVNRYKKAEFIPISTHKNQVNIASVLNMIAELNAKDALDVYFGERASGNFAKLKYATVQSAGNKAKGDLISTFFTKVSTFIPANIQKLTCKSSFDIADIGFGEKPIAIFIGLPDYDQSKNFIASIFLDQVYMILSRLASAMPDNKVPRRVHYILDEFANLPKLNDMGARIKLSLGRNMIYTLVVQDMASIHDIYQEEATAIISNCGNKFYIKAGDNETNENFSKLLGSETYININRSGKFFSLNKERTELIDERPLITAEELGKLKMGEMIIHRTMKRQDLKGNPITVYPIFNFGDDRMLYRHEYLKNTYNDKQLLYISSNILKLKNISYKNDAEQYVVKDITLPRTDNIALHNYLLSAKDYLSWKAKQNKFIDFNQGNEDNIHSFIMNVSSLTREEKILLQQFSQNSISDEEKLKIMEELNKMVENGKIVRYVDVEKYCFMTLKSSAVKDKKYLCTKLIYELHPRTFRKLKRYFNNGNKNQNEEYTINDLKYEEDYD